MLTLFVFFRVLHARFGMVLRGCKSNERRMLALGFPTLRFKLAAYVVSALRPPAAPPDRGSDPPGPGRPDPSTGPHRPGRQRRPPARRHPTAARRSRRRRLARRGGADPTHTAALGVPRCGRHRQAARRTAPGNLPRPPDRDPEQPGATRELDGDVIAPGRSLVVTVVPNALLVCAPPVPAPPQ